MAASKLFTIIAGLAFVTVGLAAPAQADAQQDREFYRLLTDPDQDRPMAIWDFAGMRSQGIEVCQREDAGETPMEATYHLDRRHGGPYVFDDANSIASSAETVYCPWHSSHVPNWLDTSNPLYPPPVYPPIAWYPERNPEMPPPEAGPNW